MEERVEEKGEEKEDDLEIIEAPNKRTASKGKATSKKKIAKVIAKVESEGNEDGVRRWLVWKFLKP